MSDIVIVAESGSDIPASEAAELGVEIDWRPILVGVDTASTFCYLLSPEWHRDADTWGVRLLELTDRGFAPKALIADFGSGLRAGDLGCRLDRGHDSSTGCDRSGSIRKPRIFTWWSTRPR